MLETKTAEFTFVKNGIFYFSRRVPKDLQEHYLSPRIAYSLRTRSPSIARTRAIRDAQQLDEYWYHLRLRDRRLPGQSRLRLGGGDAVAPVQAMTPVAPQAHPETVTLTEAVGIYLKLKGKGKAITYHRAAERACGALLDVVGDKDITAYTKADANKLRDALVERKLAGSSITRMLGTVRSVVNFAASECGVTIHNPFGNVYFDRKAGVEESQPIPTEIIPDIQAKCLKLDDEVRWLVALVSDTGMRLAEGAGLLRSDFKLECSTPHVVIQEHPWRRLKTSSSARVVPLVGASLWAAKRILEQPEEAPFAFPRYNRSDCTNSNSASGALNKWLRPMVPERCSMHSFRHSMRDRLRAVECPADIVDQIGGWQTEGVGHSYGKGYPIDVLSKWMLAAVKRV